MQDVTEETSDTTNEHKENYYRIRRYGSRTRFCSTYTFPLYYTYVCSYERGVPFKRTGFLIWLPTFAIVPSVLNALSRSTYNNIEFVNTITLSKALDINEK